MYACMNGTVIDICKSKTIVYLLARLTLSCQAIYPSTLLNDQEKISPYNINATLTGQVMRIKKNITWGLSVDPIPMSELTS